MKQHIPVHLQHHLVILTVAVAERMIASPGAIFRIGGSGQGTAEFALLIVLAAILFGDFYEAGVAVTVALSYIAVCVVVLYTQVIGCLALRFHGDTGHQKDILPPSRICPFRLLSKIRVSWAK